MHFGLNWQQSGACLDLTMLQLLAQSEAESRLHLENRTCLAAKSTSLARPLSQPISHAGFTGRERPVSIFQDSGADIRALRLRAAGLAAVDFPGPDDCQSDAVALICAAERASQLCGSHGAADQPRSHSSVLFDSVQLALLAVAFAQWQSGRSQPHSCARCIIELLVRQRLQLEAYMQRLREELPAAAEDWRSAGLLYNASSAM